MAKKKGKKKGCPKIKESDKRKPRCVAPKKGTVAKPFKCTCAPMIPSEILITGECPPKEKKKKKKKGKKGKKGKKKGKATEIIYFDACSPKCPANPTHACTCCAENADDPNAPGTSAGATGTAVGTGPTIKVSPLFFSHPGVARDARDARKKRRISTSTTTAAAQQKLKGHSSGPSRKLIANNAGPTINVSPLYFTQENSKGQTTGMHGTAALVAAGEADDDDAEEAEEESTKRKFNYNKPPKPPQKPGLQPCTTKCENSFPPCEISEVKVVAYELSVEEHKKIGYMPGHRNGLGPCCPCTCCSDGERCATTYLCQKRNFPPPTKRCFKCIKFFQNDPPTKEEMSLMCII